ncbi:reverse transcriptase [Plakobranchus ocellatus]|uniref:Reverse transcriptase n=1 Tax=Plakobranchus ocellatus TaxID=259542 RepID=A0AAV3XS04_9GAST|nr:reverse transcriptase [Plakobranchus ocellatus]
MSELTARLVKLGKDLGLEGPELRAFMKEERDREEKREAQERQEKKKKEAQERQEKREAQEREDKMRKEEQERKDKLELEKLKLQAEIENAKSLHSEKDSSTSDWIAKIPRMNPFSEAKGDTMDAFLFRFEMLVKAHNWPEDKKFLALSNLLTGESLKVLQTLSVEQQTYSCLKQALLKTFLCTAADYNFHRNINSQTNSLARHTASGIKIVVGSLWWQKVKILALVRESATVHQDQPCLYSSSAKIGVLSCSQNPPLCSPSSLCRHGA